MKASPDAETTILFTNRPQESKIQCIRDVDIYSFSDFVAGQLVQSLIGLYNKGKEHFVVSGIEASFRYGLLLDTSWLMSFFLQISSRLQLFHSKCMYCDHLCILLSPYKHMPAVYIFSSSLVFNGLFGNIRSS